MDNQFLILCSDESGPFTIEHTARAAWSDADVATCARALVDAHRALVPGPVIFHGVLVIERDGPLSLNESIRLFCDDLGALAVNRTRLHGASPSAGFGRFVGLRIVKGVRRGQGVYKHLNGAVARCDLGPMHLSNELSLHNEAPLLKLRFSLFQAQLSPFPELDNVTLHYAAEPVARAVRGNYVANYATYENKRYMANQAIPAEAKVFHSEQLEYCFAAQTAAREYTKMMTAFSGNWADNDFPGDWLGVGQCWWLARWAASLWYPLARCLGYTIPDPNGPLTDPYGAAAARGLFPYDDPTPIVIRDNALLVEQIVVRLYQAQRTLESCLAQLDFNNGLNRVNKNVVYDGRALWWSEREDYAGQPRRYYHTSEPVPDPLPPFGGLVHTRCADQHRILVWWQNVGSAQFARLYWELFPLMTKALFDALHLTHLLAAVFDPAPLPAIFWQRRVEGLDGTRAPRTDFARVDPVPLDFTMIGPACSFVQFVPWPRGEFRGVVFPCIDEVLTFTVPRRPVAVRPYPWNASTDPAPYSETFNAWIQGNAEGTRDAAIKELAGLWRRWDKGLNAYIDTFIPPTHD